MTAGINEPCTQKNVSYNYRRVCCRTEKKNMSGNVYYRYIDFFLIRKNPYYGLEKNQQIRDNPK